MLIIFLLFLYKINLKFDTKQNKETYLKISLEKIIFSPYLTSSIFFISENLLVEIL